jgi:hypothetical protein
VRGREAHATAGTTPNQPPKNKQITILPTTFLFLFFKLTFNKLEKERKNFTNLFFSEDDGFVSLHFFLTILPCHLRACVWL